MSWGWCVADVSTRAAAGAGSTAAGEQLRILHIFWISFLAAVAIYVPVPVLIGLLLAVVTRQPFSGVPFSVGAALLLYLHRPAVWPLDALLRGEGALP